MAGRGAVAGRKAKEIDATLMGKSAGSVLLGPTEESKLEGFYLSLTQEGREGYDAIISTNISTVLSSVNFINEANLSQAMLRKCGELCSYMSLQPGGMVFEEGDPADSFFIVLKGHIEAVIGEKAGFHAGNPGLEATPEAEAGGLQKGVGETFGVAALVLGAASRQYGMRANDMSLFIRITFDDFAPFLENNPKLNTSLLYSTKLFLVQRYSTMPSSIFHSFNGEELETAARVASFKKFTAGQVVYSVGDDPKAFYVVSHGEVQRDYGYSLLHIRLQPPLHTVEASFTYGYRCSATTRTAPAPSRSTWAPTLARWACCFPRPNASPRSRRARSVRCCSPSPSRTSARCATPSSLQRRPAAGGCSGPLLPYIVEAVTVCSRGCIRM